MKKFFVVLVALLATAAMVAPAFAEDRLSLGGEMRVRGWHQDLGGNSTMTWADQRLRIGGKLSIADGVSVTFRTDVTEANWGSAGPASNGSGRFAQHWDRAHIDLVSGNFHLRAGQQYVAFGNATVDHQSNGLLADLKAGAGKFTVFSMLDDDMGSKVNSDGFTSGLQFAMKNFSVFLANQNSSLTATENAYVIGATMNLDLGAVALKGELDTFTGDFDANTDATGTQLMFGASMVPSDTFTLGAEIFYATSNDQANEVRYSSLGSGFGGWDAVFDVGTALSNEQLIDYARVYDTFGNAGIMALRVNTGIKAGDAAKLGFSLCYEVPEDDDLSAYDYRMLVAGGLVYNVMDNTSLHFQVQYTINEVEVGSQDDWLDVGTGLFVKF